MAPRLVVLGDCNPDLVMRGDVRPRFGQAESLVESAAVTIGGSGSITACGAARLGIPTALIAAVGDDALGRGQLDAVAGCGVDVGAVALRRDVASGITVVLSEGDDRAMLTSLGAIATLTAADVDEELIAAADHLHVSALFLLEGLRAELTDILGRAQEEGTTVSLDTNYDPGGSWSAVAEPLLGHVDVLLPNLTEARMLSGEDDPERAATTLAEGGRTVVVKLGPGGALAVRGSETGRIAAPAVDVVDSTGAGDSFDAGFLTGLLLGEDLAAALALAVACGSLVVGAEGGTEGQPDLAAARRLAEELQADG